MTMKTGKPQGTKRNSKPNAKDVARRLIVLRYVVIRALISPPRDMVDEWFDHWSEDDREEFIRDAELERKKFWRGLRNAGLWRYVSPVERSWASRTIVNMEPQEQYDASWRIESAEPLMWALGLIEELPPYDTMADHDLLDLIPSKSVADFIDSARLRARSEIDRARDVAELWHWRSRTRELIEEGEAWPDDEKLKAIGLCSYDDIVRFSTAMAARNGAIPACVEDDLPAFGKAYRDLTESEWRKVACITVERHLALNWLCGYAPGARWDETPTDT